MLLKKIDFNILKLPKNKFPNFELSKRFEV